MMKSRSVVGSRWDISAVGGSGGGGARIERAVGIHRRLYIVSEMKHII